MKTRVKFEEKSTYALENDMNILANFSPEHLKVSKLLHSYKSILILTDV